MSVGAGIWRALAVAALLVATFLVWRGLDRDDPPRPAALDKEPTIAEPPAKPGLIAADGVDDAPLTSDESIEEPKQEAERPDPQPLPQRAKPASQPTKVVQVGNVRLRGRVLDTSDAPVPYASVQSRPWESDAPSAQVSNGTFEIRVHGDPPYTLGVRGAFGEDRRPLNLQPKIVQIEAPSDDIVIRLERGHVIGGVVMNSSGSPIEQVLVHGGGQGDRTGADGRFELIGLSPGATELEVRATDDYVRPLPLRVTAGDRDVRIVLESALTISGSVRSSDGAPLHGGGVRASWMSPGGGPPQRTAVVIDAEGSFLLAGIPPDAVVRLEAYAGRHTAVAVLEGVRPGATDVEMVLGSGDTVSGVLLHADGSPAAGINVHLLDPKSSRSVGNATTDAEGAWSVKGLVPKRYSILFLRSDGGGPLGDQINVDVPAAPLEIRLPGVRKFTGVVTGLSKRDAEKWLVTAYREDGFQLGQTRIGPDGGFEFFKLQADVPAYFLAREGVAGGDSRFAIAGPVSVDQSSITLTVKEGATIDVVVELAPSLRSRVHVSARRGWLQIRAARTDEGRYVIRGLPEGRFTVSGYVRVEGEIVRASVEDVEPGAAPVHLSIER